MAQLGFVFLCATVVAFASALPAVQLLAQEFTIGVITDTYGSYNATLQLQKSLNFEESLLGAATLTRASADDAVMLRVEVDLSAPLATAGSMRLFFTAHGDVPNITFDFDLKSRGEDDFVESSGPYKTNSISYGVYWWRFTSDNEFMLQLVDHIFSNSTTVHGYATPMLESKKPWYQNWALVIVTIGVFMMKMWLGGLEARRNLKKELLSQKKKQ